MKTSGRLCRIVAWLLIISAFGLSVYRAKVQPIAHDEALAYEWYLDGGIYHTLQFDPSNHVLFTFLSKVLVKLFGLTEFSLRGASLIGAAAYLLAVYGVSIKVFGDGPLLPMSVALLSWNPQILDFMVAARGYMLGLACLVVAVYFLVASFERTEFGPEDKGSRKDLVIASTFLALAVASNLSYVLPVASVGTAFSAVTLLRARNAKQTTARTLRLFGRYFVAPGSMVVFFILWPFLIQVRPGQFSRGLHSASDALTDLFESSFLYKWTGDIYAYSLGAAPPALGSWQERAAELGIYVLLPGIFLLTLITLVVLHRSPLEGRARQTAHCQLFGGAALASVVLTVFLHVFLRLDYPMARYCLYAIPLFTISTILNVRELSLRRPRLHFGMVGMMVALIILSDYAISINMKYFRYNAYDVFSRKLFWTIANDAQNHHLTDARVGGTWWYEPEMNFYIRRYHASMKPYDVKDKSYFWESPGALDPANYNYYFFIPSNDPALEGPQVRPVFQDTTTGLKVIALDR